LHTPTCRLSSTQESEIADKKQSSAHPLYALGMKQLETYRSVAKTVLEPTTPTPEKPSGKRAASTSSSKAAAAAGKAGGAASAAAPPAAAQPARKKARTSEAAAAGVGGNGGVPSSELLRVIQHGFARLENLAAQQLAPKLPSPLQEMHRVRLQLLQREDTDLLASLDPYYSEAVGNYLSQVTGQANNSAHPAMLPTVLEGLDTLLQAPQDAGVASSIRYTYRIVFQSYLKLINPRLSTGGESTQTRTTRRSRAHKSDDHDDDDKEGVEEKEEAAV